MTPQRVLAARDASHSRPEALAFTRHCPAGPASQRMPSRWSDSEMPPMSEFDAHTAAAKCSAPDFRLLHPQSRWPHAEMPPSRARLPASMIACTRSDQSKCCQCTRHRTDTRPPGIYQGPSYPWNRNPRPKNTRQWLREEERAKPS